MLNKNLGWFWLLSMSLWICSVLATFRACYTGHAVFPRNSKDFQDNDISTIGYKVFRADRLKKGGGGSNLCQRTCNICRQEFNCLYRSPGAS